MLHQDASTHAWLPGDAGKAEFQVGGVEIVEHQHQRVLEQRLDLRAEDQRHLAVPGRDHPGELVDQVLRGLPAADFQDRAGRARGDPAGHGPGVVIRTAQWCLRPRMGILELADADYRVDCRRDGSGLAGRPVVVDDLAVLGLEARPRRLVTLAPRVVV